MKRRHRAIAQLSALLLAACAIPTDLPNWDTTWDVPVKTTSISVNAFLPPGVTADTTNTAKPFVVTMPALAASRVLNADCPTCTGTAPKPAFTQTMADSNLMPSGVGTGTLASGSTVAVSVTNNLGFDPITAPAAGSNGWMRIIVSNNGVVLGQDSINGATGSLPAGVSVRNIPITGTVTGSKRVLLSLTLVSPAGTTPITMNPAKTVAATATSTVLISAATVSLTTPTAVNTSSKVDLSNIDSSVTTRVTSATLVLGITNPFAASGNLTVNFTGGSSPISKAVTLAAGGPSAAPTSQSITLTQTEIRSLLGHSITMKLTGGVTGANVSVTPSSTVTVAARMRLTIDTKVQP